MVSGVYKITNKRNNKVYIGLSKDIANRWKDEMKGTSIDRGGNSAIEYAIRNEGANNFKFEILELIEDPYKMSEREKYYIRKYDTFENGYNLTRGGSCAPIHGFTIWDYQEEICKMYVVEKKTITKIAKLFGCAKSVIKSILEKNNIEVVENKRTPYMTIALKHEEEICKMYLEDKETMAYIAYYFKINRETVSEILAKNGARQKRIRSKIGKKKTTKGLDFELNIVEEFTYGKGRYSLANDNHCSIEEVDMILEKNGLI